MSLPLSLLLSLSLGIGFFSSVKLGIGREGFTRYFPIPKFYSLILDVSKGSCSAWFSRFSKLHFLYEIQHGGQSEGLRPFTAASQHLGG